MTIIRPRTKKGVNNENIQNDITDFIGLGSVYGLFVFEAVRSVHVWIAFEIDFDGHRYGYIADRDRTGYGYRQRIDDTGRGNDTDRYRHFFDDAGNRHDPDRHRQFRDQTGYGNDDARYGYDHFRDETRDRIDRTGRSA
jgi:hypothetical protein